MGHKEHHESCLPAGKHKEQKENYYNKSVVSFVYTL